MLGGPNDALIQAVHAWVTHWGVYRNLVKRLASDLALAGLGALHDLIHDLVVLWSTPILNVLCG